MSDNDKLESFIAEWALTGGSELANTQSFVNGLCTLIGVDPPKGSRTDDSHNDYVFERRVFQKEADGTESFGRIDAYKRHCFVLEAKQGSDADRKAAESGEADLDIFGQTAAVRFKRGTAKRGTPTWSKAMVEARGQAERYAKALPIDHGWPPFLLVTDVGHCIDVYADFSGRGSNTPSSPMLPASASRLTICGTKMSAPGSPRSGPTRSASIHRRKRPASPERLRGISPNSPNASKSVSRTPPALPIS